MTHPWWKTSVVYQIYPRSFMDSNGDGMGDLDGIISKLDYLALLGIDVIWLSPVFQSPMDDNGYDISDYDDIAPQFGTLADMDRLIAEAEVRGIKIIMDLVVNHSSDEHPWFESARQSKDSPYRDFYIWRDAQPDGSLPSDIRSYFGGPAWSFNPATNDYYFHQFSTKQPDLNWENPAVPEAVYSMMNRWLDRGIAGFRMDVIDLIGKDVDNKVLANGPTLHAHLKAMHQATLKGRDALTVGETWSVTPQTAKLYSAPERQELSMVFQFEHIELTFDPVHGKWKPREFDLVALKQVFAKWQTELADNAWNSLFWNNHDLPRAVSKYGDDGPYRVASAKALATVLHGMQGTPYVYQGEEIGMTNVAFKAIGDYQDIETRNLFAERLAQGESPDELMKAIHKNSRDNARTPMQWDAGDNAGFSAGKPWLQVNPNYPDINVAASLKDLDSVFYHYQGLIQLRKTNRTLIDGHFTLLLADHPQVFAYVRETNEETLLVVGNLSTHSLNVPLPETLSLESAQLLVCSGTSRSQLTSTLELAPYDAFIASLT
ncbi:glycoside hydrolase family 13 protein [Saccharospirillum impatiens]|uniref:glycoside hydrolase family 13 protein n=1 Tax=Saccharospirillum impatiens TaxID=169438 RepID=UPI0004045EE5|nr:alpha-glucosidase [Saccharospirillum impatiens]